MARNHLDVTRDGIVTVSRFDDFGGMVEEISQDCEPILDHNKALAAEGSGYSPSGDLRRVASIPLVLVEKWLREEGLDVFDPAHDAALRRKLNSSEYLYLRTAPGAV
jgi:hypothetical protein